MTDTTALIEALVRAEGASRAHHRYMRREAWSDEYYCVDCGVISSGWEHYEITNGIGFRRLPVRGCVRARSAQP